MPVQSIDPSNGKIIKTYTEDPAQAVAKKIDAAHTAWLLWKKTSFTERAARMEKAAGILLERKDELARLMAAEMGKPFKEGLAEIDKCASCCVYYAKQAEQLLQNESIDTDASKSFVTIQPLGVVLAVMPWNFPFWQVFRFLAPALMAGNAGVLKHASNVPGCAIAIEQIINEAGFTKGVFQTLLIDGKAVSPVIEHPHIKAVTLTGSTQAGKQVAQKAASELKKTVLELGGSDAYIVLHDADLALAAKTCVNSRTINSGQSCIAAKRFIVVEAVYNEFSRLFCDEMKKKVMGHPMNDDTDIGPQARADLRDELHQQVQSSIAAGAECVLGGEIPAGDGAYYPPTVLINVKKGMPAYDEELFGPVAALIKATDEQDAIRIANDSLFGLGAAVFTTDLQKGKRIAAIELEAGSCFVNALVKSDPRLPFGGIKQSGYGRELGSYGIKEFVNIKTVYIG